MGGSCSQSAVDACLGHPSPSGNHAAAGECSPRAWESQCNSGYSNKHNSNDTLIAYSNYIYSNYHYSHGRRTIIRISASTTCVVLQSTCGDNTQVVGHAHCRCVLSGAYELVGGRLVLVLKGGAVQHNRSESHDPNITKDT